MTKVLAPCPGRLVPLAEVPDPVFAGEMVGPGVGIDPDPGETTVVSPIAGETAAAFPASRLPRSMRLKLPSPPSDITCDAGAADM